MLRMLKYGVKLEMQNENKSVSTNINYGSLAVCQYPYPFFPP